MRQKFKVSYGFSVVVVTTSTDLSAFMPFLRSQILFQGYRDVLIIVNILILSTLAGLPHSFICTFQRLIKLQLSL